MLQVPQTAPRPPATKAWLILLVPRYLSKLCSRATAEQAENTSRLSPPPQPRTVHSAPR